MIISDVMEYVSGNIGPVLILSDRKSHCEILQQMLIDKEIDAVLLTGNLSNAKRKEAVEKIRAGEFQTIVATGSLLGEGFDLPSLNALFMATPIRFSGRVLQYIGRILRPSKGKYRAVIYDYCDSREPVLANAARARARVYVNNDETERI